MVQIQRALKATLLSAGIVAQAAQYTQIDQYDDSNFFNKVDFFSGPDPTNGFVKYVDAATADSGGLAGFTQGGVYLGVDNKNPTTAGRASTRVTTKTAYTKGLFIADIAHMPAGTGEGGSCGLWPAFWMFGPNWPASGEIDIIEGVNNQSSNAVTLHTSPGCTMTNTGAVASTKLVHDDCQGNQGCGQQTSASNNYGSGFNAAGGGVYALEWTSDHISVWFFARSDPMVARLNATGVVPDPTTFGQPIARFVGNSCNFDDHFMNNNLVFNIDYCGDWAGQVWSQDPTCSQLAPTCSQYVAEHPEAFIEAYWLINSIKVYQQQG
ncbi:glycoside hydrolase family 16 protein [Coniochaeta ligniaria NRRL 30616]|uniref:endo-1,3(4)-beta-glucanase n=1 Tax=Coniochaeta ligniaria NRRL 30616 TaxID=1408157 RepID=A0A1J7JZB8_9PEZI|nr:glycoside hydrolase family 16 protein [Coniochaeta ligniaria NRRL 30616]